MGLTSENYSQGFLIDEELMGGVTPHPERPGEFLAFVLRHTTGEYLGYQAFARLDEAIAAINQVQRPWEYERTSGCGSGACHKANGGSCKGASCAVRNAAQPNPSPGC